MSRGLTPVLGLVVLAAVTVTLAAVVGVVTLGTATPPGPERPFRLTATADAETGRIVLVHRAPEPIDVRDVRLLISADGEPLPHQPDVPFYSLPGFGAFPTGPFNPSTDPVWEPGKSASLTATGANADRLARAATVRVELYRGALPVAASEVRID